MPVKKIHFLINLINFIDLWRRHSSLSFLEIFKIAVNEPRYNVFPQSDRQESLIKTVETIDGTTYTIESILGFKKIGRHGQISNQYIDSKFDNVDNNVFGLTLEQFLNTYNTQIESATEKMNLSVIHPLIKDIKPYTICELEIKINDTVIKADKLAVSDEKLMPSNILLFDKINNDLIQHGDIDGMPEKQVKLKLSEYYIFIITLFIFDVCHDFLDSKRYKSFTPQQVTRFISNVNTRLSTNLKLIADEWTHYYSMLRDDLDNIDKQDPQYFLNICKSVQLLDDDWNIIHASRNGLRFEAKVAEVLRIFLKSEEYIDRNDSSNRESMYNQARGIVEQFKDTEKKRFMSDNSMTAFTAVDNRGGSVYNSNYNMLFFANEDANAKNVYCKSLPASFYDGASSCDCSSLKKYLMPIYEESVRDILPIDEESEGDILPQTQEKGGLEFGKYNILFLVDLNDFKEENRTNLPSLNIISTFVNNNNTISQEITIKRNNRYITTTDSSTIYTNSVCCYPYELISKDRIVNDTVEVGKEYIGFTKTDKNTIINDIILDPKHIIEDGNFGSIIGATRNTEMKQIDIIYYVRKALCDFGQYINGVFKNGGYIPILNQRYIDNTVMFPEMVSPEIDFPFVCLHGDEPACTLNWFLLRTLNANDVNNLSHTVYCFYAALPKTVFANMYGNLLACPVETEKSSTKEKRGRSQKNISNRKSITQQSKTKKRKKPSISIKGGSHTEFTQKKHAFEILRRFFLLSFLFKMDSKYFEVFNKFCDDYYFKMDNSEILNNEQLFNERLSEIKRINDEVDLKDNINNNHKAITMTERIVHNNPHENVKSNNAKTSMIYPHPDKVSKTQGYNDLINAKIKSKHTPASPKHSKQHKHNKVEVTNSHRKSSKNKTHKNHNHKNVENHNHKNVENHNHKNVAKHLNVKPTPIYNNQAEVTV